MKNSLINKLHLKRTFTQLLAGCLFAIFILNSIVSFLFFEVKRKIIRHEIKHNILSNLPDNQLFAFSFNYNFDKDEFEHNGIMYDVVRKKNIDGQVFLLCFEDKKETELNRSIEATVKNDLANSPIKKTQQLLVKFIKTSFIPFDNFCFYFPPKFTFKPSLQFVEAIVSAFNSIPYPPPNL